MGAEAPLNLELPVVDQGIPITKPISMVSSTEDNGENGRRPWTVVVRNRLSTSISRYSSGMNLYWMRMNIVSSRENQWPTSNHRVSSWKNFDKRYWCLIHLQLAQNLWHMYSVRYEMQCDATLPWYLAFPFFSDALLDSPKLVSLMHQNTFQADSMY
jgi:hypothetical protein